MMAKRGGLLVKGFLGVACLVSGALLALKVFSLSLRKAIAKLLIKILLKKIQVNIFGLDYYYSVVE